MASRAVARADAPARAARAPVAAAARAPRRARRAERPAAGAVAGVRNRRAGARAAAEDAGRESAGEGRDELRVHHADNEPMPEALQFNALARSFFTGVAAALGFEGAHQLSVLAQRAAASNVGLRDALADAATQLMHGGELAAAQLEAFRPMLLADHAVGGFAAVVLYSLEAAIIAKMVARMTEFPADGKDSSNAYAANSAVHTERLPARDPARTAAGGGKCEDSTCATAPTSAGGAVAASARDGLWSPSAAELKRVERARRRAMFLDNFWYCVALSADVPADQPVAAELMGERLVLFRSEDGRINALNDICPHRGAPLSGGWLAKGNEGLSAAAASRGGGCAPDVRVVCPYHGWQFDGDGALLQVPANARGQAMPRRPIVSAYDCEERDGFVWLFRGPRTLPAGARPPIPSVPEFSAPGWRAAYGEFAFDAPYMSVFENALDVAHIHYLHSDSFGNDALPEIRDMTVNTDAFSATATFTLNNRVVSPMWEFTRVPEVHVTAKALLPSTSVISFTLGAGVSMITFVNTTPLDGGRAINRFSLLRNFAQDANLDRFATAAMTKILSEDKAMVEKCLPNLINKELNVNADLLQLAYRKLKNEYIDLGYGLLPASVSQDGSVAIAEGLGGVGAGAFGAPPPPPQELTD